MKFTSPLIPGTLIKRYKRFLADIELESGDIITAHCANPGAMLGIKDPGLRVWVTHNPSPSRKLHYTWEIVEADNTLIGTNTHLPNKIAHEAITAGVVSQLTGYSEILTEVKYGENSRIDLLLKAPNKLDCYVEVKNVHLKQHDTALFPDSVTKRGTKHLQELMKMAHQGHRAVMLYVIQRNDCKNFAPAAKIDPVYAENYIKARENGVECYAYECEVSHEEIRLSHQIISIDIAD
jgi:sugar fermentation stimulation protein A